MEFSHLYEQIRNIRATLKTELGHQLEEIKLIHVKNNVDFQSQRLVAILEQIRRENEHGFSQVENELDKFIQNATAQL